MRWWELSSGWGLRCKAGAKATGWESAGRDQLLNLQYHEHLWMEKEIKTVANITHFDIGEFLPLAAEIPLRPEVETYSLHDANRALIDLKRGSVRGAKVLIVSTRFAA